MVTLVVVIGDLSLNWVADAGDYKIPQISMD